MLNAPYGRVGGYSGENDRQSKAAKPAADISAGTTWRETVEVSENLCQPGAQKSCFMLSGSLLDSLLIDLESGRHQLLKLINPSFRRPDGT